MIVTSIINYKIGGYTRGYRAIKALWRRRLPSPKHGQDNLDTEPCAGDVILAEPAPSGSKPESCCTRLLRLVPRAVRIKFDAYIAFESMPIFPKPLGGGTG